MGICIWLAGTLSRYILAIAVSIAGVWLARRHPDAVGKKTFIAVFFLRFALSACFLAAMGGSYGDITGWYLHGKWMSAEGLLPGRDFHSPYYIGFNALLAACVWVWNSPLSILLLFTMAEFLGLRLFFLASSRLYGTRHAKQSLILYLSSPLWLVFSVLAMQDEPVILLFAAALFYTSFRTASVAASWVLAFCGVFFSKILAVFYLQPLLQIRKYKTAFAGFAALGLYFCMAQIAGIDPFDLHFSRMKGMQIEGCDIIEELQTIGNVWYFAGRASMCGTAAGSAICAIALGLVSLPFLPAFLRIEKFGQKTQFEIVVAWMTCIAAGFFLFNPMTYTSYLIPFYPFLMTVWHENGMFKGRGGVAIALWVALMTILQPLEMGAWMQCTALGIWERWQFVFQVLNAVPVGLEIFILIKSYALLRTAAGAPSQRAANLAGCADSP